jgi:hypothetical protein
LKDPVTLEHAKFLKMFKGKDDLSRVYDKYPYNGLVMNWASGSGSSKVKHYLQALLLTDCPFDIVCKDLQLDEKIVKLYCDLYFSCRSAADDYAMVLPMETRLSFAFGEVSHDAKQLPTYVSWRVMAVRNGYSVLMKHWGMEKFAHGKLDDEADPMDRTLSLVHTNMEQQIRSGTVGFRSLVEYVNSWQGYKKLKDAVEERDGVGSPLYELLGGILMAIAPKLVADQVTEKEKKAEAKANKKKLLAEKNIELHNSDDEKSKSVAAEFNKIKREKFKLIDSSIGSKS